MLIQMLENTLLRDNDLFTRYKTGSFTFNGTTTITVDVGFFPKFVMCIKYSATPFSQTETEKDLTLLRTRNSDAFSYFNSRWNVNGTYRISEITGTGFSAVAYTGNTTVMKYYAFG